MDEEKTRRIIRKELDEMKVPHDIKGFRMLESAIYYILEREFYDPLEIVIMENAYMYIARKHKSTRSKVERNIRYACSFINENLNKKVSVKRTIYWIVYLIKEKELEQKEELFVEQEKLSK